MKQVECYCQRCRRRTEHTVMDDDEKFSGKDIPADIMSVVAGLNTGEVLIFYKCIVCFNEFWKRGKDPFFEK